MTTLDAGIALVRAFGRGARFEVGGGGDWFEVGGGGDCVLHLGADGAMVSRVSQFVSRPRAAAIAAALTACHAEGLAAFEAEGSGVAAIDGGRSR